MGQSLFFFGCPLSAHGCPLIAVPNPLSANRCEPLTVSGKPWAVPGKP